MCFPSWAARRVPVVALAEGHEQVGEIGSGAAQDVLVAAAAAHRDAGEGGSAGG